MMPPPRETPPVAIYARTRSPAGRRLAGGCKDMVAKLGKEHRSAIISGPKSITSINKNSPLITLTTTDGDEKWGTGKNWTRTHTPPVEE